MDEHRLHSKLDKIIDDQTEIKVELASLRKGYDYHVYRCDLLEDGQNILKDEAAKAFSEIREDIAPLKSFRDNFTGAVKWTGLVLTFLGVAIGFLKLIFH